MAAGVFGLMYAIANWGENAAVDSEIIEGPTWQIEKGNYTNTQFLFRLKKPSPEWQFELTKEQMLGNSYFPNVFWKMLYHPVVELQIPQEDEIRAAITVGIFPNRNIYNSLQLAESIVETFQDKYWADSTFAVLKKPTQTSKDDIKGSYTVIKLPERENQVQVFVFVPHKKRVFVISAISDIKGYDYYNEDIKSAIESFWFVLK